MHRRDKTMLKGLDKAKTILKGLARNIGSMDKTDSSYLNFAEGIFDTKQNQMDRQGRGIAKGRQGRGGGKGGCKG
ncbi:hypothetical protein MCHI_000889 [Candidatus Magnetoovum chiemensis]|nr:hypothetical protein MCHI_000889 [Candidatus Magnetoovum chiemensis]